MPDTKLVGSALAELADYANCASGDFHLIHLNVKGIDFDTIHKALKKYYEAAAEDYDSLAELARMYEYVVKNPSKSAERIGYEVFEEDSELDREKAIEQTNTVMDKLLEQYLKMFSAMNKIDDCVKAVGVANFLQTRIEYWSKERYYFNRSRA